MADITNDKAILEEQPSDKTLPGNPPDPELEKNLDRAANKSATRASESIKRYDRDHDIFTK
jgi:hypothetical protein